MNNTNIDTSRIFTVSCVALIVTAMTFAIRAGILGQLSADFGLTDTQLGWINAMAFLGFPVATMLGGFLYNLIGAKRMLAVAFIGHLLGLLLTIFADGFWLLLISSFCIGFANGAVEAGCNPLIANLYHKDKTTMLNRFHVWFPGGIVIGALVSKLMTDLGLGWQLQIAVMLVPTLIYGIMAFGLAFPRAQHLEASTSSNIRALASPLFLFMVFCMTLTATTELGIQQWIERVLGSSGASPMLIMAMVTGIMAIGRFFCGSLGSSFASCRRAVGIIGGVYNRCLRDEYCDWWHGLFRGYSIRVGRDLFLANHAWLCCGVPAKDRCFGYVSDRRRRDVRRQSVESCYW